MSGQDNPFEGLGDKLETDVNDDEGDETEETDAKQETPAEAETQTDTTESGSDDGSSSDAGGDEDLEYLDKNHRRSFRFESHPLATAVVVKEKYNLSYLNDAVNLIVSDWASENGMDFSDEKTNEILAEYYDDSE